MAVRKTADRIAHRDADVSDTRAGTVHRHARGDRRHPWPAKDGRSAVRKFQEPSRKTWPRPLRGQAAGEVIDMDHSPAEPDLSAGESLLPDGPGYEGLGGGSF